MWIWTGFKTLYASAMKWRRCSAFILWLILLFDVHLTPKLDMLLWVNIISRNSFGIRFNECKRKEDSKSSISVLCDLPQMNIALIRTIGKRSNVVSIRLKKNYIFSKKTLQSHQAFPEILGNLWGSSNFRHSPVPWSKTDLPERNKRYEYQQLALCPSASVTS